jgi:hypothetical protein
MMRTWKLALRLHKAALFSICAAAALLQMGCSTHTFQVKYEPTHEVVPTERAAPLVAVGSLLDDRGTESTWLGAIRGGYGNPLKKLYSDQPISSVVATAIADALQARALLAPPNSAALRVDGSITKLDCSYYFNREAHAHLLLNIVETRTNATLFSQTYKTDSKEAGVGAGIFGDVDHLAAFMQKTLNETIDKALSDPVLLSALSSRPTAPSRATAARLEELERLRQQGLVTDAEYDAKRKEILSGL